MVTVSVLKAKFWWVGSEVGNQHICNFKQNLKLLKKIFVLIPLDNVQIQCVQKNASHI